jgi:membrane associated rhomboid family serine protease
MDLRYCPRCRTALRALFNGQAELDHCPTCRGNWLDAGKTAKSFGAWAEPAHWLDEHIAEKKGLSGMWCPGGHGHLEAWDVTFEKQHVEIDICPTCTGMWLDQHEGGQLAKVVGAFEEKKGASPGVLSYFFQLFTGFPIEVFNPVKKTPWLVYGLIVTNVLIFGVELSLMSDEKAFEAFIRSFSAISSEISRGEDLWTLVTHAFLHGGIMHLVGNMYFLWIFGDNVEDRTGRIGFTLIYGAAALAGALLQIATHPSSDVPLLGASGAISGLMGAYLVLFPRVRVWVVFFFVRFQISIYWYFLVWIGLQILGVVSGQFGVAWFAHLGGFAAGLGVGFLYRSSGKKKAVRVAQHGAKNVNITMSQGPRGF